MLEAMLEIRLRVDTDLFDIRASETVAGDTDHLLLGLADIEIEVLEIRIVAPGHGTVRVRPFVRRTDDNVRIDIIHLADGILRDVDVDTKMRVVRLILRRTDQVYGPGNRRVLGAEEDGDVLGLAFDGNLVGEGVDVVPPVQQLDGTAIGQGCNRLVDRQFVIGPRTTEISQFLIRRGGVRRGDIDIPARPDRLPGSKHHDSKGCDQSRFQYLQ